jgi:hypothetical protein
VSIHNVGLENSLDVRQGTIKTKSCMWKQFSKLTQLLKHLINKSMEDDVNTSLEDETKTKTIVGNIACSNEILG